MKSIVKILTLAFGIIAAMPAAASGIDWAKVDQALGKKGAVLPGDVHKVGLLRTDLHVTLDGVDLKPGFALGSHLEFKPTGKGAMLMGDLVLTEDEVSPVMKRLIDGGIEITALHNHLLRMSPPILYMHVGGEGDPVKLAETLHAALILSKTPFAAPAAESPAPALDLDTAAIDRALGAKGSANGRVYRFGFPRAETIRSEGMIVPPAMGTAIGINFQPTGSGRAAITGDFVLLAKEVNPVLKTLRANGIEVTALHTHMLYEKPRLFFMHFWANDDALRLAKGLRAALDKINIKKN
jgi:Domain of Unknown Function (DUF1259)